MLVFFQNISSLDTQYFNIDDSNICKQQYFFRLILSSRYQYKDMQKKFEKFQELFKTLKFNFSAVCLSETWCDLLDSTKNPNYRLHGYKSFHQTRMVAKEEGSAFFYVTRYPIK